MCGVALWGVHDLVYVPPGFIFCESIGSQPSGGVRINVLPCEGEVQKEMVFSKEWHVQRGLKTESFGGSPCDMCASFLLFGTKVNDESFGEVSACLHLIFSFCVYVLDWF